MYPYHSIVPCPVESFWLSSIVSKSLFFVPQLFSGACQSIANAYRKMEGAES